MSLPPVFVELRASIGEFQAKMAEAQHEIDKLTRKGASGFDKLALAGKAALLGVSAGALAIGGIAVRAALKGELAHAALAQAVKNTGASMEGIEPHVSALTDKFAALGFTRDDLERGLASLTTSLRSPAKAFQEIGLAADLARFKNIDLADASLIVAKALEGQLRPLRALGIDLPVAAGGALKLQQAQAALAKDQENYNTKLAAWNAANGHTIANGHALEAAIGKIKAAQEKLSAVQLTGAQIQDGLNRAIGGQAAAAAATDAGKLKALQVQVENLAERLGNYLLPKIEAVVDWMSRHKRLVEDLAKVIGGVLVAAMAAYVAKLTIAVAETTLLVGRTIALNVAVAVAIIRARTAAGAMDAEALSARGLAGALTGVGLAGKIAMNTFGAIPDVRNLKPSVSGSESSKDIGKVLKKIHDSFTEGLIGTIMNGFDPHKNPAEAKAFKNLKLDKQGNFMDLQQVIAYLTKFGRGSDAGVALLEQLVNPPEAATTARAKATAAHKAGTKAPSERDPYADLLRQIEAADHTVKKHKATHKSKTTTLIENLRKRLLAEKEAALAAARASFLAHERTLQAALLASQEATRRAELAARLAQQAGDITLANGALANEGLSFGQIAARSGTTVNLQLGGVYMSLDQLRGAIADGLRGDARRNVTVGLA